MATKDVATAACWDMSVTELMYVVMMMPPPTPSNADAKPTTAPTPAKCQFEGELT